MPGHEEKILSKLDKLPAFLELIIHWKRRAIIRYPHKGVLTQCDNCPPLPVNDKQGAKRTYKRRRETGR